MAGLAAAPLPALSGPPGTFPRNTTVSRPQSPPGVRGSTANEHVACLISYLVSLRLSSGDSIPGRRTSREPSVPEAQSMYAHGAPRGVCDGLPGPRMCATQALDSPLARTGATRPVFLANLNYKGVALPLYLSTFLATSVRGSWRPVSTQSLPNSDRRTQYISLRERVPTHVPIYSP